MKTSDKNRLNNWTDWYNSLPEHTKQWLKNQPIYKANEVYKFIAIGAVVGFVVGLVVGYEWAWRPAVQTFRPLIG
jgi:ElaB/YqjD/DUF883 family membrane-anchored ribosome-binding protein